MECPVKIHKVTDDLPEDAQVTKTNGETCPVTGNKSNTNDDIEVLPAFENDDFDENPSMKEYKKLKRVMGMITQFYRTGTNTKREAYETMCEEVGKLEVDENMVRDQIAALNLKPLFQRHPKRREYLANLEEELENLLKQKERLVKKRETALELSEWSKVIVEICEWLELNLDDYCVNQLKLSIKHPVKPVPQLTPEQMKQYSKGLGEITYNLAESQDFFQASLDGRLQQYHNIEKSIIEAQLEVMKKYPEDSLRRMYVQNELEKDLEYVKSTSDVDDDALRRREKMLKNHQEFYKVLKFHKEKLKAFGVDPSQEVVYDPKYDHYQE